MPHLNGLEATRQIKKSFPQVQVLILTMYTNEEYIFQVLKAGASGYLVKQSAPDELLLAIEVVHRGDSFLSPSVSKKLVDEFVRQGEETAVDDNYDNLTVREREVLQLVAEGHSNREIANMLHISIKTVGVHRSHLMEKLNIHNVTELIKYAIRKGVIILD
jgi:DNA-binding NarL/FixJ family response regulator